MTEVPSKEQTELGPHPCLRQFTVTGGSQTCDHVVAAVVWHAVLAVARHVGRPIPIFTHAKHLTREWVAADGVASAAAVAARAQISATTAVAAISRNRARLGVSKNHCTREIPHSLHCRSSCMFPVPCTCKWSGCRKESHCEHSSQEAHSDDRCHSAKCTQYCKCSEKACLIQQHKWSWGHSFH